MRQVMLKALDTTGGSDWNCNPLMVSRVWLLCHDSNPEVSPTSPPVTASALGYLQLVSAARLDCDFYV